MVALSMARGEPVGHRVLVAGVGNIFLGDDGFGGEVANRLARADLPDWVRVADYGISGMHLAYDMADGYDTTILVDATARGGQPGTLYVIEPEQAKPAGPAASRTDDALASSRLFDAHGMQPEVVFGLVETLGAEPGRVLVVGCEPASIEHGIGLSAPVAAAVDEAVRIVMRLVNSTAGATTHSTRATSSARERWSHVPRHTR
jgi:hydrogenase maturation protease